MNVLSIGTDESIFMDGSEARMRQRAFAQTVGELHMVIPTSRHGIVHDGPLTLYPSPGFSIWFWKFWSRLYIPIVASRVMHEKHVDLVTVQDPFEIGLLALPALWGRKVPLYVQVHTDFLSPEYARHSLINRARALVAGYVLRRASRIRVVSERIKKSMQERYRLAAPITVLPIHADIDRFRNASQDPHLAMRFANFATKLLVVGRLEPEKNVELAIRAFAQSARENVCLIIVGEGGEQRRLRKLARVLHLDDRVFFEGAHDPAAYYALADLVLVPSKYEGHGLVIVEALAAGKPVLSTDVGVAREAGAIIATPQNFPRMLSEWFENGPRKGELRMRIATADETRAAIANDMIACV